MSDNDSPSSNTKAASPSQDRTFATEGSLCEFDSFEYHAEDDIYRALFSSTDESASTAVVSAVAAVLDIDPLDMDPLHATVDTDALDSLITPQNSAVGDLHVTFEYCGYEVTASSYGSLKVKPPQGASPPAADD